MKKLHLTMKRSDLQSLKLTRTHFEFVANLIGEIADGESRQSVLEDNCMRFRLAFPRFDEKRFRDRVETVVIGCWIGDPAQGQEDFLAGSNL
jgi:hypothetical protein